MAWLVNASSKEGISMKNFFLLVMAIVGFGLLAGCSGVSIDNMVPPPQPASTPVFEKTLKVHQVSGAKEEIFGGPELVSNEEYTEAVVETLKQSNLFRNVVTTQTGDWDLTTTIVAHGQGDGLDYRSAMVVEYRIVDTATKKEIWKKGFNSRHEVTVFQAFSGAARTTKAQEGSVRKNLQQFIASLASAKL